jgi:hypothetical protein
MVTPTPPAARKPSRRRPDRPTDARRQRKLRPWHVKLLMALVVAVSPVVVKFLMPLVLAVSPVVVGRLLNLTSGPTSTASPHASPSASALPTGVPGRGTARAPVALPPTGSCGVLSDDQRLHCDNTPGVEVHRGPHYDSPVTGILQASHSWFSCWEHGDPHAGDNDIWYRTRGNVFKNGFNGIGFMPAYEVQASVHPAPGLQRCNLQLSP